MAVHFLDVGKLRTRYRQQMKFDAQEMFADNAKAGIRQQVVHIGHAACRGVFNGNHGQICLAAFDRLKRVFEGAAGQGFMVGPRLHAGNMGVGTGFTLVGNFRSWQS